MTYGGPPRGRKFAKLSHYQIFRSQGIEPTEKHILLVKSNVHFRAAFTPIAAEIIDVDTPGLTTNHLETLPFQRITRPLYPFDDFAWDGP